MSRFFGRKKNKQCCILFIIIIILSFSLIDIPVKSVIGSIGNGLEELMVWTNSIVSKPENGKGKEILSAEGILPQSTILQFRKIYTNGIRFQGSEHDYIEKTLDISFDEGYINAYDYGREAGNGDILTSADIGGKIRLDKISYDKLAQNYYIVDASTKINSTILNPDDLFRHDFSVNSSEPTKILIYHTHASETYKDSKAGKIEDTVVGMGEYLTELLEGYGYDVIHDTTAYDRIDGRDNRNKAYTTARPAIEKTLEENPDIDVIIDLHRDSGAKRVTEIGDKKMAKIMFFNGLCRNTVGKIDYLENKNLEANLAFSLQMKMTGDIMYPGLFHKIYLKNYRYNMHFCEKYLLIELGTENNTVKEAYNAMPPLADVLDTVLSGRTEVN